MKQIRYEAVLADAPGYTALRNTTDWGDISLQTAQSALAASLGGITAYEGDKLIGMARYIGDGVLNIYIQDVIVTPQKRAQSIGKALMSRLITQLKAEYPRDCTIGLMAARGQDGFYAPFGFIPRPSDVYGAGMIAPLGDLQALSG